MTIDEAISHALEVAERQEYLSQNYHEYVEEKWNVKKRNKCAECAAEHRQLAEWLTELKEAKRLLKSAVEDLRWVNENTQDADGTCIMRKCEGCGDCPLDINGDLWCKWKHEEAALKLIGETNDEP